MVLEATVKAPRYTSPAYAKVIKRISKFARKAAGVHGFGRVTGLQDGDKVHWAKPAMDAARECRVSSEGPERGGALVVVAVLPDSQHTGTWFLEEVRCTLGGAMRSRRFDRTGPPQKRTPKCDPVIASIGGGRG